MKNVLVLMGCLLAGVALEAREVVKNLDQPVVAVQQDEKVKIKPEELPDAVKKTLEGPEYRGWLVNAAYHNKSKKQYEVELKNGAEVLTVLFDQEGKKLEK